MSAASNFNLAVIGGGLAGLSAGVCAAANGASVVCFEPAPLFGGLVANIGRLDDYPGAGDLAGVSLAEQLVGRAKALDVTFVGERVTSLDANGDATILRTAATTYSTKVTIVASGARLRELGVPGERELIGRGVSQCDWCDGSLYRGQQVAVVGGGNAAVQAALHLAELCAKVTVIARAGSLRARRDYVLRAADNPKIEFLWETAVDQILGTDGVQGLRLRALPDNASTEFACAAVFIFVGLAPNLEFAPALNRDDAGFAITDASYRSSMPRVFVIGAARNGNGGSLLSAMGEAMTAATTAIADLRRADEI
ncbi:MAG: FAD-dependent oxidoreductase [Burkholderiales bacterium]